MEEYSKNKGLNEKIKYSINLLQKAEKMALSMNENGFHLAFSGGKDSIVLYRIAELAKVKFFAEMSVTTIDPPELMRYIRKYYPQVKLNRPDINFYELIKKKKMLPTRMKRYCCIYLKEQAGQGTTTLVGVRAAESVRRAKRKEIEIQGHKDNTELLDQFNRNEELSHTCVKGKDKIIIMPIFHWTDKDVWNFIREQEMDYCQLYDEGHKRIGCIFCPMANKKSIAIDRKKYPRIEKQIKKSIQYILDNKEDFLTQVTINGRRMNADEVFEWWVSKESLRVWAAKQNQQELF